MNKTKKSLILSVISMVLCIAMLAGSTYAWFTDSVTSVNNVIKTGSLDLKVYWTDDLAGGSWNDAEDSNAGPVFEYELWEPGYTAVRYIKIVNDGSLAFKYTLNLVTDGDAGILGDVIDVYCVENASSDITAIDGLTKVGVLNDVISGDVTAGGVLLPEGVTEAGYYTKEIVVAIALHMQESAGNEYQDKSVGASFALQFLATQFDYESDDLGSDYDDGVEFPTFAGDHSASADVSVDASGAVTGDVSLQSTDGEVSATIPAGTMLESGTSKVTLTVSSLEGTKSNVTVSEDQILNPVDVHVSGVAAGNTTPITVTVKALLKPGLNSGNHQLYHVENGVTNAMTAVATEAELTAHNTYYYDPATGDVTMALCSFSEITAVQNRTSTWTGGVDHSWYDADATELYIANADQLRSFSQIVGGMASKIKQDNFRGKTVTLLFDIDLNDAESANDESRTFYPIGYYNSRMSYTKVSGGSITSNVSSFEGTFDGNGKTIKNFYQNTWEMFGDYNSGYSGTPNHYKDAMGLFGYVLNGTVKNLTIENFSSDGEFTPTGVVAAYACNSTFQNISIINCNPRVYNTGNGGIVGIGGNSDDPDTYNLTFNNITVDNSNKITALWGSWDVACGGLVGMFRGDGHVYMTNCSVAAQIDAYNDVCGNYQYYWYRYSGMLIGTNYNMTTDAAGYTVPESEKFHATSCTVHFGDWNNYYYCELVANSLASYTHDHQMSRLTQVESVIGTTITPLEGDAFTVPSSGRYNYVVVNGTHGTENATCYHFVDGKVWNHTDAGKEMVGGAEVDKEDKQHIYLPFKQLFTGYGWGVKHVPIYENDSDMKSPFAGVTILDRITPSSTQKFEVVGDSANDIISVKSGTPIKISELFKVKQGSVINSAGVYVSTEEYDLYSKVSGEFTPNTGNWAEGTITFSGTGILVVGIQDYDYCTPTYRFVEVYNQPADVEYFYSPVMMAQNTDGWMWYQSTLSLISDTGFDYARIQHTKEAGSELHLANWRDGSSHNDYAGNPITLTTDGSTEYYVVVKVRASATDSNKTTPIQLGIHYKVDGNNTALIYANVTSTLDADEWVTLAMKLEIPTDGYAHQLTTLKLVCPFTSSMNEYVDVAYVAICDGYDEMDEFVTAPYVTQINGTADNVTGNKKLLPSGACYHEIEEEYNEATREYTYTCVYDDCNYSITKPPVSADINKYFDLSDIYDLPEGALYQVDKEGFRTTENDVPFARINGNTKTGQIFWTRVGSDANNQDGWPVYQTRPIDVGQAKYYVVKLRGSAAIQSLYFVIGTMDVNSTGEVTFANVGKQKNVGITLPMDKVANEKGDWTTFVINLEECFPDMWQANDYNNHIVSYLSYTFNSSYDNPMGAEVYYDFSYMAFADDLDEVKSLVTSQGDNSAVFACSNTRFEDVVIASPCADDNAHHYVDYKTVSNGTTTYTVKCSICGTVFGSRNVPEGVNAYIGTAKVFDAADQSGRITNAEFRSDNGDETFARIYGGYGDYNQFYLYENTTGSVETGRYLVIKYRVANNDLDQTSLRLYAGTKNAGATSESEAVILKLPKGDEGEDAKVADGQWHVAVIDLATMAGLSQGSSLYTATDDKYYAKFVSVRPFYDTALGNVGTEDDSMDIAYAALCVDYNDAKALAGNTFDYYYDSNYPVTPTAENTNP